MRRGRSSDSRPDTPQDPQPSFKTSVQSKFRSLASRLFQSPSEKFEKMTRPSNRRARERQAPHRRCTKRDRAQCLLPKLRLPRKRKCLLRATRPPPLQHLPPSPTRRRHISRAKRSRRRSRFPTQLPSRAKPRFELSSRSVRTRGHAGSRRAPKYLIFLFAYPVPAVGPSFE